MPTIIFIKSHIAGYVRKDGTTVKPHEDKRTKKPSKIFGSVAGLAKKAHAGLSSKAKEAVDSWNINWTTGGLERAVQAGDDVAAEISAAFKPVREKLRSIYGDTMPMYRGEGSGGTDSKEGRKLFSWSPLVNLAQQFVLNADHGIPKPITDDEIARTVEQYNRTGFAQFGSKKFKRNKSDPDSYDIYDKENGYVTDGDDLEDALRDDQRWRAETIADMKAKGNVYQADVPVDDLVWIPVGINLHQPEIIARYNPRTQPATVMAKSIFFLKAPPCLT